VLCPPARVTVGWRLSSTPDSSSFRLTDVLPCRHDCRPSLLELLHRLRLTGGEIARLAWIIAQIVKLALDQIDIAQELGAGYTRDSCDLAEKYLSRAGPI